MIVIFGLALCVFIGVGLDLLDDYADDWERRQYDLDSHRRLMRELERQPW